MKNSFFTTILFCGAILFTGCNNLSNDERICMQTRKYTIENCPLRMDQYTMLDSMVYHIDGKVMSYHYSLSGVMDTDSIHNSTTYNAFHDMLLNNILQNTGLHELRQHNVSFQYIYISSTTGKEYMRLNFTPSDYNK
jgi:hypothetical protein